MSQTEANAESATAAAPQQQNMDRLEELRIHITENFGESLAPVLERVLFQRGWQNCTLDEFYQNLNSNSTSIIAECRRNINEPELVISIEENLLRALFMGHGQNAVQMVQALRYYSLEDRFLAMVSPVALAKLLSGLNQSRQPGSPAAGGPPRSGSAYGSAPNTPLSGNPGAYSSAGSNQGYGQQAARDNNYPQQPQGSPNHRVQPPASGFYSSQGASQTTGGTAGNSWGIGGNGHAPAQQLSPYPNNRQQPNNNHSNNSNNNSNNNNQNNNQNQMPHSYSSQGGPQFPQANSFESDGSHGGRRGQQPHHHHHQQQQQPAPPAPAPLFYEGDGQGPPRAIGSTPTTQGVPQMSWADEAEQEEYNRQTKERNEAELKEFLDANESAHLFNAVKKYSLAQLRSFGPKTFEKELKRLVCSSSMRKGLMDLLHPDGNYPEDLPENPEPQVQQDDASGNHYAIQQDPAQRQHQRQLAARQEATRKAQGGQPYGKDVASTNALLDTLKVGTPEKVGRGNNKRGPVHDDPTSPNSKGSQKAGMKAAHSTTSLGSNSQLGSQMTSPNSNSMNSRLFFDDDPAYQQAQQQQQQMNAPASQGGVPRSPATAKNVRNQRGVKPLHSDSDYTPTSTPVKGPGRGGQGSNSILVLKGVKNLPLEAVAGAVARMGQIVDSKPGREEDEVEFILASYNSELSHSRFINVRYQQQTEKVKVAHFKKGNLPHENGRGGVPGARGVIPESGASSICKYYNTNSGCHRGDLCKYIHTPDAQPQQHGKFKGRERKEHAGERAGPPHPHAQQQHQHPGMMQQQNQQQLQQQGEHEGLPQQTPAPRGKKGAQKPRSLQPDAMSAPQQQHEQNPEHNYAADQQHGSQTPVDQQVSNGSRTGSNLPSPQKNNGKLSTPIDEIPKPRSFQEAMRSGPNSRNSPHGGSPNGQYAPAYPAPQYNQGVPPPPPPQYDGSHPQTPVYEEAQHHTVPNNHSRGGTPTQQGAPSFSSATPPPPPPPPPQQQAAAVESN